MTQVVVPKVESGLPRALFGSLFDYAGLFPPAACSMAESAERYRRAREGPFAWLLGAFVVPAKRLRELADVLGAPATNDARPWPLGVLLGEPFDEDLETLADARVRLGPAARVAAVELAPAALGCAAELAPSLPRGIGSFWEISLDGDLDESVRLVSACGGSAKVRTGGVVESAIPSPERVAAFLLACRSAGASCKATAGLHHAIRGEYALTYERDSARAVFHGFLNLLAAALHVATGDRPPAVVEVAEILREQDRSALRWTGTTIDWRGRSWTLDQVAAMRRAFVSIGSCSFDEPVGELVELGVLGA